MVSEALQVEKEMVWEERDSGEKKVWQTSFIRFHMPKNKSTGEGNV